MKQPVKEVENDYETDNAVDTLIRAEEIKGNKKLMAKVKDKLSKKGKAIKSIQDLKDLSAEMDKDDYEKEEEEDEE